MDGSYPICLIIYFTLDPCSHFSSRSYTYIRGKVYIFYIVDSSTLPSQRIDEMLPDVQVCSSDYLLCMQLSGA